MLKSMQKMLALSLSLTCIGVAYGRGEIIPIQDRAQGQSLVAGHLGNDSLYSNPAAAAFTQLYSVEGTFRSKKDFAVSILDTKTSAIGGALGYFRAPRDYTSESVQGIKLGFAWKASEQIAVGVAGKHIWGNAKKADDPAQVESRNFKDIDLGVSGNFGRIVQLGATTRNLFGGDGGFDEGSEHAFGIRLNYDQLLFLSLATHTEANLTPYQYGAGVEYVSPYKFALKAGYRQVVRGIKGGHWSLGASLNSPKIALHYAVEFPTRDDQQTEHSLALAFLL